MGQVERTSEPVHFEAWCGSDRLNGIGRDVFKDVLGQVGRRFLKGFVSIRREVEWLSTQGDRTGNSSTVRCPEGGGPDSQAQVRRGLRCWSKKRSYRMSSRVHPPLA